MTNPLSPPIQDQNISAEARLRIADGALIQAKNAAEEHTGLMAAHRALARMIWKFGSGELSPEQKQRKVLIQLAQQEIGKEADAALSLAFAHYQNYQRQRNG